MITSKTEVLETGHRHPVTTTVFECSNMECRGETDKQRELQKAQMITKIQHREKQMQEQRAKRTAIAKEAAVSS